MCQFVTNFHCCVAAKCYSNWFCSSYKKDELFIETRCIYYVQVGPLSLAIRAAKI